MERETILKPGKYFLIFFICLGLTIILPRIFPRFTLENQNGLQINEISASNTTDCYHKEFRLEKGYLFSALISNYYDNITIRVKFVTKLTYLQENSSQIDPDTNPGEYFIATPYVYPDTPTTTPTVITSLTINQDDSYRLDFMGDGTTTGTDRLWSLPGDYVILVWGTNSTNFATNENILFDIEIQVDGLDDLLFSTLGIISIIVLIAACVMSILYAITKKRR